MEIKKCQVQSEFFGIFTETGSINFFKDQSIVSAIFKNTGTKTALLWGEFPLLPNESITLGNNAITSMFRQDVIKLDFTGTGTQSVAVIVDKLI